MAKSNLFYLIILANCQCDAEKPNPKIFEERAYQTALLDIAKKRNIIACLPTGSGKTYIALILIQHFEQMILE